MIKTVNNIGTRTKEEELNTYVMKYNNYYNELIILF
jgi:hypothetical protein